MFVSADGLARIDGAAARLADDATDVFPGLATLLAESNDQTGAASVLDDWCGAGSHGWTGPEMIYELTATVNTRVTVTLADVTADVVVANPPYVAVGSPELAADEIETWAEHPYMAQVLIKAERRPSWGHPMYDPIWAEATMRNCSKSSSSRLR